MRGNLDDEKREYIKKEDNKRKRVQHDNLDDSEKEHLKKEDNKRKKEK